MEKYQEEPPLIKMGFAFDFMFLKMNKEKKLSKIVYEMLTLAPHNPEIDRTLKDLYRKYRKFVKNYLLKILAELECDVNNADPIINFLISAGEGSGLFNYIDPHGFRLKQIRQTAEQIIKATMHISI